MSPTFEGCLFLTYIHDKLTMDDKMNLEFYISDLIAKKIKGGLSDDEERFLAEWEAEKKENSDLLRRLLQSPREDYLRKEEIRQTINKDKGWQHIKAGIRRRSRRRTIIKYTQSVAAVLAVFVVSAYLISTYKNSNHTSEHRVANYKQAMLVTGDGEIYPLDVTKESFVDPSNLTNNISHLVHDKKQGFISFFRSAVSDTIIVPRGAKYKFTLMDGTKVWLNSNSKLVFPTQFEGGIRQISLKGEGFFEVAPNKAVPFVIDVDEAEVKVVGTAFNINAYDEKYEMVTTVVEGKVIVNDDHWEKNELLMPNEQLCVNTLTGVVQRKVIDAGVFTAWTRGRLVFENESLDSLMKRLERLYDVNIIISDDVDKTIKFTGDIKRYDDLNDVLDMLATTQNVKFSVDGQDVVVSK